MGAGEMLWEWTVGCLTSCGSLWMTVAPGRFEAGGWLSHRITRPVRPRIASRQSENTSRYYLEVYLQQILLAVSIALVQFSARPLILLRGVFLGARLFPCLLGLRVWTVEVGRCLCEPRNARAMGEMSAHRHLCPRPI